MRRIGEANATTITTPIDAGTTPRRPADLSPRPAKRPGSPTTRSGDAQVAVNSIVVAALTNTTVKCGIVAVLGGAALRRAVLIATGAILVAAHRRDRLPVTAVARRGKTRGGIAT